MICGIGQVFILKQLQRSNFSGVKNKQKRKGGEVDISKFYHRFFYKLKEKKISEKRVPNFFFVSRGLMIFVPLRKFFY